MPISYLEAFTMYDISETKFVAELIVKSLNPNETTTFGTIFSKHYNDQSNQKYDTYSIVDRLFIWSSTDFASKCETLHNKFRKFCDSKNLQIENTADEIINDFVAFYYNNLEG